MVSTAALIVPDLSLNATKTIMIGAGRDGSVHLPKNRSGIFFKSPFTYFLSYA